jgi:proteasome lid subunit RPN8/RPN11
VIELPRSIFEEIVAHALEGLPNEACGVIAGMDGHPVQMFPIRNIEESPVVYRFDEKEQLEVFNEVEDRGLDLLGFWHSHTATDAYPSPTDRARALWKDPVSGEEVVAYPGTSYLIVSLADRENPVIRAFRFEGGSPVEEDVRIA